MSRVLRYSRDPCSELLPYEQVLLGLWCVAPKYEAVGTRLVLGSPWRDRKMYYNQIATLNEEYELTLAHLASALNQFHNLNYPTRSWRILIGPWLRMLIGAFYDRLAQVDQINQIENLSGFLDSGSRPIATIRAWDTKQFQTLATESNEWNDSLFRALLETETNLRLISYPHTEACDSFQQPNHAPRSDRKSPTSRGIRKFTRKSSFVPWMSLIPRYSELLLELSFRQVPGLTRWNLPQVLGDSAADPVGDAWCKPPPHIQGSRRVLWALIQTQIPKIFLEDYPLVLDQVMKSGLPRNPRTILTSNAYALDEAFKIYSAEAITRGAKLVAGQHGGGYGIGLEVNTETHETKIADKFLSWGWDTSCGDSSSVKAVGNFVAIHRRRIRIRAQTQRILLLMQNYPLYPHLLSSHPIGDLWYAYFEQNVRFVRALSPDLAAKISVRLYPSDYSRDQVGLWRAHFPDIEFADEDETVSSLESRSRLVISGSNDTHLPTSLASPIPSAAFIDPFMWETRKSCLPALDALRAAKYLHDTPEQAAEFVNETFEHIDLWWQSVETRKHIAAARYLLNRPTPLLTMALGSALHTKE